jgi:hypothetical protein
MGLAEDSHALPLSSPMTLCVAWRFQNRISIASDSRISSIESGYADIGVKILECPVKIITAINRETGHFDVLHESTIGIGIAGSFLTAYLVKEQVTDVLPNLQYVGDPQLLTFEKIAGAAFKIYRHGIETLTKHQKVGIDADMFLVGRCPASGQVAAAKFFVDPDDGTIKHETILQDAKNFVFEALGAGEDRLRIRVSARLAAPPCMVDFMVLEELRTMIVENEVSCVGGAIQYGKIHEDGFEIFGVADYRWDGPRIEPMPSVRGIDARAILSPQEIDDLYLSERMIDPFRRQMLREIDERKHPSTTIKHP